MDLSLEGGRLAGTMPVAVGVPVGLFIDASDDSEDLIIEEAIVIWLRGSEFRAIHQNEERRAPVAQTLPRACGAMEQRSTCIGSGPLGR